MEDIFSKMRGLINNDSSAKASNADGQQFFAVSSVNNTNESDSSSAYSSSVSSVESTRDRAHLTLDFKSMKPRSNKTCVQNVGCSSSDSFSPQSLPREIIETISQLSPEKIFQAQQTWKTAVLNGAKLSSPQFLQNNNTARNNTPQPVAPTTKTDETPTPSTFIYPKNVTTPQEAFAEGFQKVLSRLHSKNQFEPPSCTPSTAKLILSLLTPTLPQPQQQQTQDIISLFRQSLPSSTLSSPIAPFFNAPSLPTTGAAGNFKSDSLINSFSNNTTSEADLTSARSSTTDSNTTADRSDLSATLKRKSSETTSAAATTLAYQHLLLSPTAQSSATSKFVTSNSNSSSTTAAHAAAVAAAVVAAVQAVSPTTSEPLRKSPRISAGNTPTEERQPSIGQSSSSKIATELFNGLCKLDPNNPSYMEFLHHQQQQHHHQHQQQQQMNVPGNFVPNFAPVSNSGQLQFPLNFGHTLTTHQHQHLSTSQHHSPQPPAQQQQQHQQPHQIILPLQPPGMAVKQENEFLQDALQAQSSSSLATLETSCEMQSKYIKNELSATSSHKAGGLPSRSERLTYSGSSCGSETMNGYGNQNNPYDEDQERKKLERKRARNRMAASKCRQRKLERITELEEQVHKYQTEGVMLQSEIQHLKRQVDELNETMNRHRAAGCSINTPFKMSNI